jgi:hypothetical protein
MLPKKVTFLKVSFPSEVSTFFEFLLLGNFPCAAKNQITETLFYQSPELVPPYSTGH